MPVSRIPSLNWLRVFEAAARTGSFAGAARELGMSGAAVSQQIRSLETHLGKSLFDRAAQSVRLSEAGEAFLPAVQQSLLSVESAAAGLFGTRAQEQLGVQASLLFAVSWLVPRLPAFRSANPHVRMLLSTGNDATDFERGRTGLQIVFGPPPPETGSRDQLFGEVLYPVARPDIAERIACVEDLSHHPLLEVTTHHSGWLKLLAAREPRLVQAASFEFTDSTVTSFALAAAGSGIALARSPASDGLQRLHGLAPCVPGLQVAGSEHYWLTGPGKARAQPAARRFRDWLLAEADKA